ncbi:MAG TPA: hypothetical protein VND64_31330 [Pirellulales bacterium]|nr:hypothetical protein [Pirellulales bacterium]
MAQTPDERVARHAGHALPAIGAGFQVLADRLGAGRVELAEAEVAEH